MTKCIYNQGVDCQSVNCEKCGWNPAFEKTWKKEHLPQKPDVVEVVRCKDCKHRKKTNTGLAIWDMCFRLNHRPEDDFFCGYGEKEIENGDAE